MARSNEAHQRPPAARRQAKWEPVSRPDGVPDSSGARSDAKSVPTFADCAHRLPSAPAGVHGSGPYDGVSELLGVAVEFERRRGRGAQSNASGRYEPLARVAFDDGWRSFEELPPFKTSVSVDATRKIITRNDSPDIGFDRSINPYRGCEHGCVYCFARPTHAYLGLSPGLDFESKLFAKPEAADLLARELSAPTYEPRVIAIGTNTDPYQPIERRYQVMRRILEVLDRANHPVGIVTKSALVLRDLDILARMANAIWRKWRCRSQRSMRVSRVPWSRGRRRRCDGWRPCVSYRRLVSPLR